MVTNSPASGASARATLLVSAVLTILSISGCMSPPQQLDEKPAVKKKDYARPLPPGATALRRLSRDQYPDFSDDFADREGLVDAVQRSLDFLAKPSSVTHFPVDQVTHVNVKESLEHFAQLLETSPSPEQLAATIRRDFDVYISVGCDDRGTVLFTGYCQPIYEASLTRTGAFQYPLYKLPPDLVKASDGSCAGRRLSDGSITPGYYGRREIEEENHLDGLELVYLKDRLEAYIVHVQGSAKLRLTDGTEMSVGYAGKTQHQYQSLGEALIKAGKLPSGKRSLQGIKDYFRKNPSDLARFLYVNDRYIFFTHNEGGPYGSLGQPVTARRSIATDKSIFPRGSLCFIDTKVPALSSSGRIGQRPLRSFMLDQDTGGAIRSAGRCDIFLGTGDLAERVAGFTYSEGQLYYLFLKNSTGAVGP